MYKKVDIGISASRLHTEARKPFLQRSPSGGKEMVVN
jgi:hypothetical protein